jgi:hypothetical protein
MVITIPSSDDGVLPQTYISVEGFKVLLTITPLQLIKLYIKKLNVGLLNVAPPTLTTAVPDVGSGNVIVA